MGEQAQKEQTYIAIRMSSDNDEPDFDILPATHLGGDLYQLDFPPVFHAELGRLDIILCKNAPDSRYPLYTEVVESKGHQILGLGFTDDVEKSDVSEFFENLDFNGIAWFPWVHPGYLIDVPPEVNIVELKELLSQCPTVTKVVIHVPDSIQ